MAIPAEKINYSEYPSGDVLSKIFSNIDIHALWQRFISKNDHLIFFYKISAKAIDSCISGKYTDFDAQTTSNCCHGMSLLVRHLILSAHQLNLKKLQLEINQELKNLESSPPSNTLSIAWLPWQILGLASLYLLTFVGIIDPNRGRITSPQNLKLISQVSTNFSRKIVTSFQLIFSNVVANGYSTYLNDLSRNLFMNGVSIGTWGKYIQPHYLRKDKRGVQYASCIFSMQIALAHLIQSRAKIAIVNDLFDLNGESKGRYVRIFEGDGQQFRLLTNQEIKLFEPFDAFEPIAVFGGCAFSNSLEIDSLRLSMDKWLDQIPSLVLACDTQYPQFPSVADDLEFDNSPIVPKEHSLLKIIRNSSQVKGVALKNPSLFFLTHIYPASLGQVLQIENNEDALPLSSNYIPKKALSLNPDEKVPLATSK